MEDQRIDVQGPAEREATPNARGEREEFISLEIKRSHRWRAVGALILFDTFMFPDCFGSATS
jgi:hypothetical protein